MVLLGVAMTLLVDGLPPRSITMPLEMTRLVVGVPAADTVLRCGIRCSCNGPRLGVAMGSTGGRRDKILTSICFCRVGGFV